MIGRRALRLTLKLAWLLPGHLFAQACSSSGSAGSAGTGSGCQTTDDCIHWLCVCKDGNTGSRANCVQGTCGGPEICDTKCTDHGGVASVSEQPTVRDSPECTAFCNKVASLNCGGTLRCDTWFWCALDANECAEQKRASLQCEVDNGTWQCIGPNGWGESAPGCPTGTCPQDAGTD